MTGHADLPKALALFDLDGTLLRGATVCEVLADALGQGVRMREIEQLRERDAIAAARHEMAGWYRGLTRVELQAMSLSAALAPDALSAIESLQRNGIVVAIASITWLFAVDAFAGQLGVRRFIGTDLLPDQGIAHVWPEDKATFLKSTAHQMHLADARVFAIGDTSGDVPMLNAAGRGYFVGRVLPADLALDRIHVRDASLTAIANDILDRVIHAGD